jgi:chaperone modulatory protein CbpM
MFSADCVTRMRTASKLRLDFDLDLFAVALLLDHIQRIETLERQVRSLEAQLPTRH